MFGSSIIMMSLHTDQADKKKSGHCMHAGGIKNQGTALS
jgi:hypothetical protein